ncbi:alanine racemase [Nocardia sp. NPDC049220]|uniref:alanine racemase n=1 Tax=Nocardia sp. NPDC049220 TaxID=3155273 RepID=UPI0033CC0979
MQSEAEEAETTPTELDRLFRLVATDRKLISPHVHWDPDRKVLGFSSRGNRDVTIELRTHSDDSANAVVPRLDHAGHHHVLNVATWASDLEAGRGIARYVEAIRAMEQYDLPRDRAGGKSTTMTPELMSGFAELRYLEGKLGQVDAAHKPAAMLQNALEGVSTDLGLRPNDPGAAIRMALLAAWDPRSGLVDRFATMAPSFSPDAGPRFSPAFIASKAAAFESLWHQVIQSNRFRRCFTVDPIGGFRGDTDSPHTYAELLAHIDADHGSITGGNWSWDPFGARFVFDDGNGLRAEVAVWTSREPTRNVADIYSDAPFHYHMFVAPGTRDRHLSLAVADGLGQIRYFLLDGASLSDLIGRRANLMTGQIVGRHAQLRVIVGRFDRLTPTLQPKLLPELHDDMTNLVADLGRLCPDSANWMALLASNSPMLAKRVAKHWESSLGLKRADVTSIVDPPIDDTYVHAIREFHGSARPLALDNLTLEELRRHIETDLDLITDDRSNWTGNRLEFTDEDGLRRYVDLRVGPVDKGAVASWRTDETHYNYCIEMSPRAHPQDVSRAVKGALDQIIERHTHSPIPWANGFGQLRVVVGKLDAAAALGLRDEAQTLRRKLLALAADLGMRPTDPYYDDRMELLAERDPHLAQRHYELISQWADNRSPIYDYWSGATLGVTFDAVRLNSARLSQRHPAGVIGEVGQFMPVETARAMREGGVRGLHASLPIGLQLRAAGETLPITVTGLAIDPYVAEAAIRADITIGVASIDQLRVVAAAAEALGATADVAVEVDTGKHAGGVPLAHYPEMSKHLGRFVAAGSIRFHAAFTELAHGDDPWHPMNDRQAASFIEVSSTAYRDGVFPENFHIAGAAMTVRQQPGGRFAARLGAPLYGDLPVKCPGLELQSATEWVAHVGGARRLRSGESFGYDGEPVDQERRIAWVGVGYMDGVPYELGRSGDEIHVLVNGVRCRVAGPVNMDQFPIEVPEGVEFAEGDVAVLVGSGVDSELTSPQWAAALDIPFELWRRPLGRTSQVFHDGAGVYAQELYRRLTRDRRLAPVSVTLDRKALVGNVAELRRRADEGIQEYVRIVHGAHAADAARVPGSTNPNSKFMLVGKADMYGGGFLAVLAGAPAVDGMGVAGISEALKVRHDFRALYALCNSNFADSQDPFSQEARDLVALRNLCDHFERKPLVAWQTYPDSNFEVAIMEDVQLGVPSPPVLRAVAKAAGKVGKPAKVHLVVNTGLNREGASPEELEHLISALQQEIARGRIVLEGVMSHMDHVEAKWESQYRRFRSVTAQLAAGGLLPPWKSLFASSAGKVTGVELVTWNTDEPSAGNPVPNPYFDIRAGKAPLSGLLPGYAPDPALRPVLTVESRVAQVFRVAPGEGVGPGGHFTPKEATMIARVQGGYAHLPIPRRVRIDGRLYPVAGQADPHNILIDLGPHARISEGAKVTLLGSEEGVTPRDWVIDGLMPAPYFGPDVAEASWSARPGADAGETMVPDGTVPRPAVSGPWRKPRTCGPVVLRFGRDRLGLPVEVPELTGKIRLRGMSGVEIAHHTGGNWQEFWSILNMKTSVEEGNTVFGAVTFGRRRAGHLFVVYQDPTTGMVRVYEGVGERGSDVAFADWKPPLQVVDYVGIVFGKDKRPLDPVDPVAGPRMDPDVSIPKWVGAGSDAPSDTQLPDPRCGT